MLFKGKKIMLWKVFKKWPDKDSLLFSRLEVRKSSYILNNFGQL